MQLNIYLIILFIYYTRSYHFKHLAEKVLN